MDASLTRSDRSIFMGENSSTQEQTGVVASGPDSSVVKLGGTSEIGSRAGSIGSVKSGGWHGDDIQVTDSQIKNLGESNMYRGGDVQAQNIARVGGFTALQTGDTTLGATDVENVNTAPQVGLMLGLNVQQSCQIAELADKESLAKANAMELLKQYNLKKLEVSGYDIKALTQSYDGPDFLKLNDLQKIAVD